MDRECILRKKKIFWRNQRLLVDISQNLQVHQKKSEAIWNKKSQKIFWGMCIFNKRHFAKKEKIFWRNQWLNVTTFQGNTAEKTIFSKLKQKNLKIYFERKRAGSVILFRGSNGGRGQNFWRAIKFSVFFNIPRKLFCLWRTKIPPKLSESTGMTNTPPRKRIALWERCILQKKKIFYFFKKVCLEEWWRTHKEYRPFIMRGSVNRISLHFKKKSSRSHSPILHWN